MDSILSQTFRNFELLIVDDGSDDDSVAIVRSYAVDLSDIFSPLSGNRLTVIISFFFLPRFILRKHEQAE